MRDDSKTDSKNEKLSLPLYMGGLAVTLCGVQAVASSMAQTDITVVATLLTFLGFGFSLACRKLHVQPRVIEIACMAMIVAFIYLFVSQQFNLSWFLRGADKTEDQLAAALMWGAVVWSWTLISDDNVMFSCVLTAAMIGLTGTSNVNTPIIVYFCLFVLAMMFLLIHHNDLQSRTQAAPVPGKDDPKSRRPLLAAQAFLATLCVAVVLGLAALVVVPAQAVFADLSLAQTVRQLVNAGRSTGTALPLVSTQFSDDADLDVGLGSQWPTGTDTVMRVTPSDGLPYYWRGRTYDLYVGDGWHSSLDNPVALDWRDGDNLSATYPIPAERIVGESEHLTSAAPLAPAGGLLSATIEVHGDTQQFYYADEPRFLVVGSNMGITPRLSADGRLDVADHAVRGMYRVMCDPVPDVNNLTTQTRLRRAGQRYPFSVRRLYLHSPNGPSNSITTSDDALYFQNLLETIFQDLPPARLTPLDKALAIRNWVASHCTYSLSVDALPHDTDHVRAFLDGTRTGYCDIFASSVVVLCRTAGIPARVATGFAPGEQDGKSYNLRAMDKHAWGEAFFPGAGWVVLDATVGSRADESVPTGAAQNAGGVRALWGSLTRSGPVPLLLMVAIAVLLAWIGKNEVWDRFIVPRRHMGQRGADPDAVRVRAGLGQSWAQMTRELGRLGLPRRVSETPAEYAARARVFLREQELKTRVAVPVHAVDALTAQFALSRYGNAANDVSGADAALSEFTRAARRARRVLIWRRVRQAFGLG